jgi:hypothetical protein
LPKRSSALTLLVASAALPFITTAPGAAEESSGCAALSGASVSLPVSGLASHVTGAVPLRTGETLRLAMSADGAAAGTGSIAIVENGEADTPVLSGAAPQQTTFTAPYDGLFGLEFRVVGPVPVGFMVSCDQQTAEIAPSTSPDAFVGRRAARAMAGDTDQASLRRRQSRPDSIDKAVKHNTVLGKDGEARQVIVTTSVQNIAAAEGQKFADDKLDIWVEGRVSRFEQQFDDEGQRYTADGSAGTLNLGTDVLLQPGLMVGALVQLDQYGEDYDGVSGTNTSRGMLAGPYASFQLAPDLVFDARVAWGSSENHAALPDGTHLSFDTDRQLLRGRLSGNRKLLGLQFTPSVALAVVEDRIVGGNEEDSTLLEQENAVMGRLGVGSTLSYRFALDDGGYLQPSAGLSTGWTLDELDGAAFRDAELVNDSGAKAEAGLALGTADGVSISATGAIEGIGEDDYSAWSGRLSLTAPLN